MLYPPLPSTVVPVAALATLMLVVWLGWGSFRDPETVWAPGNLSRYHADVTGCVSCHEPFHGPVSGRCIVCHSESRFIARAKPSVTTFHREVLAQRKTCLACHTEHRGALAQITANAMFNPHGEFIFRATGTGSCSACHQFSPVFGERPLVLDNETVRRLFEKGAGAHRPGRMADCLICHAPGRFENERNGQPGE
ncbi:MAG: hypothetical protein K2X00_04195 [Nitrospiraceae bacterium]|nr:hypothetical protein [Nitrospiraceae bacterium]OQW64544.1 MAG: hypothetical protein BVN29_12015 [Nitrospira sp. ST-bin5]